MPVTGTTTEGMSEGDFAGLLAAAASGDEAAFARLFRDLNPPLLRYLRVAAPDWAEDLASESWLQIARDIHSFSGDERAFRSWAFAVARHRLLDHRRSAARRPQTVAEDAAGFDPADRDADPAVLADTQASTAEALRLIATLPPDQAEVIALRVVAGLDVAEVARVVGKRPGAVRVLAHRGLRRLADRLRATKSSGVTR
jgi:RNA polymerase sigma-70 factor (ECF subfamily)